MSKYDVGEELTLLETMLMPFFSKQEHIQGDSVTNIGPKKRLSTQDDDSIDEKNYGFVDAELDDDHITQVIFERHGFLNYGFDDHQSVTLPFQLKESLSDSDLKEENGRIRKRCKFIQTRNENYRTFMEEAMLIKYCSKKILQCLEDTKSLLEKYTEIERDPGFGRTHATQAWVWILKEALASSFLAVKNDKNRKKLFHTFSAQLLQNTENNFKQLMLDTKNVVKTYDKVLREFNSLMDKALVRFSNNMESSMEYEMRTSGYNFFFHQKDSVQSIVESKSEIVVNENVKEDEEQSTAISTRSLKVRCGVDGITLRPGKLGSNWLKFQKVDQDKDMQLLMKIFANKLTENCMKIRKRMYLIHEILEVHNNKRSSSQQNKKFHDSILHSVNKCQEILNLPPVDFNFFPKEKVIMLYTLKTTKAAFELIKSLLAEYWISTDRQYTIVRELAKQQKQLKNGNIENRFPINLNSRFEMLIKDTTVNIDVILNRYPNIRNAKELKDKLLKKYAPYGEEYLPELEVINIEISTETIFKCSTQLFYTPSTQELIEMFRKLISEKQNIVNNPNPAHFLFADVEHEYVALTKELTTSRVITEEMLALCSDPIQKFHQAALEISSSKDKMLTQIVYATQKLIYTQSGNSIKKHVTPVSSWIQAICKIIHVWDFHILPKHLQNHFRTTNEASMRWIAKLEDEFRKFTELAKVHKEEVANFHDFIEANHGFITWVRRIFHFNPPHEIISKWATEELDEDSVLEDIQSDSKSPSLKYHLYFHDFDMSLVQQTDSTAEQESTTTLIKLNKSSSYVQIGIVAVLFTYINQIVSSAIVNLNCARIIHEKCMHLKSLKNAICPNRKLSSLRYIYQLEDLVLAITFEAIRKNVKETVAYVGLLNNAISQFNRMFQTVQLHLEDRGIVEIKESSASPNKQKSVKKNAYYGRDDYKDDVYLNETLQLLKSSVEAMPNVFPIQDEHLIISFLSWVKLADRDTKLMLTIHPPENYVAFENINSECELGVPEKDNLEIPIEDSEIDPDWPIDFEEAMMLTTTGKAFFPDPIHFSSNIECWRSICFKMLATALDKFREMTNKKIIDAKLMLNNSHLSQMSSSQQDEKKESCSIGYAEGLCSILYLTVTCILPKYRRFVSNSAAKSLKEKFSTISSVTDKFKKGLDATEKVLVNSLSLSMASVEHKRLPQYLPILPLENDFLKSHDLEEVGSRTSILPERNGENGEQDTFRNFALNNLKESFIEVQWDSSKKSKLFCKSFGNSEYAWLEFSELNISGQLRLIHIIVDEMIQGFNKALELLKEAKEDLIYAKKLLEKTWEGIGKDMKRGRIPGSGVVVLLKLYRHQVATAVINLKSIRKTTGEVKYVLSQSIQYIDKWMAGDDGPVDKRNVYIMNLNHTSLTVILKTTVPGEIWLLKDEEKTVEKETQAGVVEVEVESEELIDKKNILEIKEAVRVNSSTSMLVAKNENDSVRHSIQSFAIVSNLSRAIRGKVTAAEGGKIDFESVSSSIQELILNDIYHSLSILKQPNCSIYSSTPNAEMPNVIGILTALVAVTVDIRFFKDIMPDHRNILVKRFAVVQEKLSRTQNVDNGICPKIMSELKRLKNNVQDIDAKLRRKINTGEYQRMENILVTSVQPTSGITPMEFVEDLAASIDGHIWTIYTGMHDVGTVLKNNKRLESHAVPNIPLSSRLEVLFSVVNYVEKIMDHVQGNLECSKTNIAAAKSLLKTSVKNVFGKSKRLSLNMRRGKDDDNVGMMSKSEVTEYLYFFASITNVCTKAEEHLSQVLNLCQKAHEILQHVALYINLKFKLEPAVGLPSVDSDAVVMTKRWQNVNITPGLANSPNLPPPGTLKKIAKKTQKQEIFQMMYKNARENKLLELEVYFERLRERNHIAVDVPIPLIPVFAELDDD